ncbi:hypothetical protein [Nocardia sp. NPDC050710]|uniref:hypothetical protein n=1 Tax=Nocardia sp. NPDC050710 TaxID=3157220 RepID=UPI0033E60C7D
MSDRSPEDEIRAELRQFGHSLQHLLRLHAQAGNWLERCRVRKQISRTLRVQRREEQAARAHQLVSTQQMIDRYRVHALAVAVRAVDPSVDHDRRFRDAYGLAQHVNMLRTQVIANDRLTMVERGIALDGLDAATVFPQFAPGRLFDNAHKVRGVEALKYRAQVARELGADTYTQQLHSQRQQRQRQPTMPQQQVWAQRRGPEVPGVVGAREAERRRGFDPAATWETSVRYHRPDRVGPDTVSVERGWHRDGVESMRWALDTIEGLQIEPGTRLSAAAWRDGESAPQYISGGTPDEVREALAERISAARRVHTERSGGVEPSTPPPPDPVDRDQTRGEQVGADRLAAVERQLSDLQADRDRLGSRVLMLQRGLDAVTDDRDEMKTKLETAEGRIEELKNRNIRLANEIGELRDRPGMDEVAAQRDRYKRERDEAVHKLAERTPERARYGSPERRAEQAEPAAEPSDQELRRAAFEAVRQLNRREQAEREPTAPWPPLGREDVGVSVDRPNGQRRNGIERSR